MKPLTLRLLDRPVHRLDMSAFTPERLAGRAPEEIGQIPIWQGNRQRPAGELFRVTGRDPADIRIETDSDRLDGIGAGMTRGSITVEGRAGAYLGRAMQGGDLRVLGDTGIFAGSAMSGGSLRVDRSCGDYLGAPIPGERHGMRGGLIEVRGNAGDRAGDRLRRGTILIAGSAGDYTRLADDRRHPRRPRRHGRTHRDSGCTAAPCFCRPSRTCRPPSTTTASRTWASSPS